jgi:DUF1365 family protein
VQADEMSASGLRQERDKRFYVSPFIAMEARYHFRLGAPGEHLKVRILETDQEGPLLAATFQGRQWALTAPHLLVAFFALPFVTLKVVGGIHFEAARLWLKGLRIQPRPNHVPRSGREKRPGAITVSETSG